MSEKKILQVGDKVIALRTSERLSRLITIDMVDPDLAYSGNLLFQREVPVNTPFPALGTGPDWCEYSTSVRLMASRVGLGEEPEYYLYTTDKARIEQLETYQAEARLRKKFKKIDPDILDVRKLERILAISKEPWGPRPKVVYIAHPMSGDIQGNMARVATIAREITLRGDNVIPFAPYFLSLMALDDARPHEREAGMAHNEAHFGRRSFDELWLYGDRISPGMWAEVRLARRFKIPVIAKSPETQVALLEDKAE